MKFWDTSAIIPLLADEPTREGLLALLDDDPEIIAWWGTAVEITSALARRERENLISTAETEAGLTAARALSEGWYEVLPTDAIRRTAERLLRAHPLRAADSLQLAAAIVAADHDPATLDLVCLDARLIVAARREGFKVLQGN